MPSIGFFLVFIVAYEMVFDWLEARKAGQGQAAAVKQNAAKRPKGSAA